MPSLTPSTENLRLAQALEVYKLITIDGLSEKNACAKVNISPWQYHKWLLMNNDSLAALRSLLELRARERLLEIDALDQTIFQKIVEKVDAGNLDFQELLSAHAFVEARRTSIIGKLGLDKPSDETDVILPGPKLIPGQSKLRQTSVEIGIRPRADGSIAISYETESPIIDVSSSFSDTEHG